MMTLQCREAEPERHCQTSCAFYRTGHGECPPLRVWSCPDCPWIHAAHPDFPWDRIDTRTVEVHQTMLCPNRPGADQ